MASRWHQSSSFDIRLPRTDLVIRVRLPRWRCLLGVFRRARRHLGCHRPDMADGCVEQWPDREFLSYIWHFERRFAPRIIQEIERHGPNVPVVTLKSMAKWRSCLILRGFLIKSLTCLSSKPVVSSSTRPTACTRLSPMSSVTGIPAALRSADHSLAPRTGRQGVAAGRHDRGLQGDPRDLTTQVLLTAAERAIDVKYIEGPFNISTIAGASKRRARAVARPLLHRLRVQEPHPWRPDGSMFDRAFRIFFGSL